MYSNKYGMEIFSKYDDNRMEIFGKIFAPLLAKYFDEAYLFCKRDNRSTNCVEIGTDYSLPCSECIYNNSNTDYYIICDISVVILDNIGNICPKSWRPGCGGIIVDGIYIGNYCKRLNILTFEGDIVKNIPRASAVAKVVYKLIQSLGLKERRKVNVEPTITIGCDPEFEELSDPRWYEVIEADIDCDYESEIGKDGAGDQIEIRPSPAFTPKELVGNVARLIQQIDVPISVRGDVFPLGGHIHFGLPPNFSERLVEDCVHALDVYVGKPLRDLSGKARGPYYGNLGDYEMKDHGFEYRTPPSAYFVTPRFAEAVFTIAQKVVEYVVKGNEITRGIDSILTVEDYEEIGVPRDVYYTFKAYINAYRYYKGEPINGAWERYNRIKISRNLLKANFTTLYNYGNIVGNLIMKLELVARYLGGNIAIEINEGDTSSINLVRNDGDISLKINISNKNELIIAPQILTSLVEELAIVSSASNIIKFEA